MSKSTQVLAVLCSDIHLSHRPPIGRSAEPDWYKAMARDLKRLRMIQQEHNCPVICAGDVFDKWNSPAELINFAMAELPKNLYAIPGQHDLPNHRYDDVHRSAYWTLVRADVIKDLSMPVQMDGFRVYPYPWGAEVRPLKRVRLGISLAVVHAYCWKTSRNSYPGASGQQHLRQWERLLQGYTGAVFGDNHQGFYDEDLNLLNCGTFMRRRSDDPSPTQIGMLMSDGTITTRRINHEEDQWITDFNQVERLWDAQEFIDDLSTLSSSKFDFKERVKEYLRGNGKVSEQTERIIVEAME